MEEKLPLLTQEDFIKLPQNTTNEYKEIRDEGTKLLYKILEQYSTNSKNYNNQPYKDRRNILWIPIQFKKNQNSKPKKGFIQIYKNGTDVTLADENFCAKRKINQKKLKLNSFNKLLNPQPINRQKFTNHFLKNIGIREVLIAASTTYLCSYYFNTGIFHSIAYGILFSLTTNAVTVLTLFLEPHIKTRIFKCFTKNQKKIIEAVENSQIQPNPKEEKTNQQQLPNPETKLRSRQPTI